MKRTENCDVLVVGFGAAGAAAAIEAADAGARVIIADRYQGGGSTMRSGGVIYAGGGTRLQRELGFDDDPEQMAAYLSREQGDSVTPELIEAFCEQSRGTIEWLESLGVNFPPRFYEHKATQPPEGFGLFFTGNEKNYADIATPAPRGHAPSYRGAIRGQALFAALADAVVARGVRVRRFHRLRELKIDVDGRVVGAHFGGTPRVAQPLVGRLANLATLTPPLSSKLARVEVSVERHVEIDASSGVVLSTGGFAFNRDMVEAMVPECAKLMPLGTPGDDGVGQQLAREQGAALEQMNRVSAWRFLYPPEGILRGLLVNIEGERICDESLYGATINAHIAEQPQRKAYLIVDQSVWRTIGKELEESEHLRDFRWGEILGGDANHIVFRDWNLVLNRFGNRVRADSLSALAQKLGMRPATVEATVRAYNEGCDRGRDELGKPSEYSAPLKEPPYYAIDCRYDHPLFFCPFITLGGVRTAADTGQVLRASGEPIQGLFAAGRSAAGICAGGYVTGLSLADCLFSGRRAGQGTTS